MDFKDSNTLKNLQQALEIELRASTKYRIYADKSREDGFEQIGNIFEEISQNEKEHAKLWIKLMNQGEIPYTLHNLKESCLEETYEFTNRYSEFAEEARKEGYEDIASLFDGIAGIEGFHGDRFRKLADNIEAGKVFCRNNEQRWLCLHCGNVTKDYHAPRKCPICGYSQGFYQSFEENY